jgi:ArsR family transcriptional regulator, arsenate/arsenite/antimonite-responsive transcriptional repressor
MAVDSSTDALGARLQRLTGEDAACCVPEYENLAEQIEKGPRFAKTLERARALADEGRLMAVSLLRRRGELCACEIQAALKVTHATVSHHMRVLTNSGIVRGKRRGKWMYYRLQDSNGVKIP